MLDDPDTLLGGLQRGRGDAIRALLFESDGAISHEIVIACLCTPSMGGSLGTHILGYVELVERLGLDLSPWFVHIASLPRCDSDQGELDVEFLFNLLFELAAGGDAECRSFVRLAVTEGPNWRVAIADGWREGLDLDTWKRAVSRMTTEEILAFWRPHTSHWAKLEKADARVAAVVAERRAVLDQRYGSSQYRQAAFSQHRFKVLERCIEDGLSTAPSMIIDGLWDANSSYRLSCADAVAVEAGGVRVRLSELAASSDLQVAKAAQCRLGEDSAGASRLSPS